jgi:hypothetical protein
MVVTKRFWYTGTKKNVIPETPVLKNAFDLMTAEEDTWIKTL